MGYPAGQSYKIFDTKAKKIFALGDVVLHKDQFPYINGYEKKNGAGRRIRKCSLANDKPPPPPPHMPPMGEFKQVEGQATPSSLSPPRSMIHSKWRDVTKSHVRLHCIVSSSESRFV